MADSSNRAVYFSFFMFTADLRPDDTQYTKVLIQHMRELRGLGYAGFDLAIAPTDTLDHRAEVESYVRFKRALDNAGLDDIPVATNVAATRTFDPSSPYREQREVGLAYLKSRVDITAALGGNIMAGPIILPYNVFPTTDTGEPIWSDALQEWLLPRYRHAQPILDQLGEYAQSRNVKLAVEPVDHWETPSPNMVADVLDFLDGIASPQVGVTIDSAHVVLGSDGPSAFDDAARRAVTSDRLNYVHISAPDRGTIHASWIPWKTFLDPLLPSYNGPLLLEIFNAIPAFLTGLHLTRRKFWIPGEDEPAPDRPDAYTVAGQAIAELRDQLSALQYV
jgi:sugar phosphate isomerase/epimerase